MRAPSAFLQNAAGIGALCAMDAVVKYLAQSNDVSLIVLGRYVAGSILALGVWWAAGRPPITRAMLPGQVGRGMLIAACAWLFYWSLTRLPLAEAITLTFIAPLLVAPMASLFLGETMQWRFLAAAGIGLLGVLVTTNGAPSFDGDRLLALGAALTAAIFYAGNLVVLRARAASDGSTITTLMGAVVPLVVLAPLGIGHGVPPVPVIGWLALCGLLGNLGIQLIARAYGRAPAQALAVLEFTALPWAALFGWLCFGEPVRPQIWAGGAIIAAACLWASRPTGRREALVKEPIGV